tara:strand:+ start:748 stop:1413 length:666 start_codon:yes stop_codon:yes gene_type:complete
MADVTKFPGNVQFAQSSDFTSAVTITDTTDASSKETGALKVAGGIGVEKKLHAGTGIELDAGSLSALNLKHQYTISGSTGVVNLSGSDTETVVANHVYIVGKSDGTDVTLPTPAHVGEKVKFIVIPASSDHTITTHHASTLYEGYSLMQPAADAEGPSGSAIPKVFHPDMSNDRIMTFGANALKGSTGEIVMTCTVANGNSSKWMVEAELFGSGTMVTPFS